MKVARSTDPARVALNGTVVDAPGDVSHAGFCADRTMTYLRAHGAQGPSFIHMGIYAPHPPLNPPREIYERYRDVKIPEPHRRDGEHLDKPAPLGPALERRTGGTTAEQFVAWRRYFYAMCTLLDEQIGRVLKFLEARGELDDTLIVFQSDHGDMAGDHGLLSKGHVTLYPECMRIPLVFHWPKGIPGGRRVGGLVEAVDILPTMLDLCGAPVPRQLPGRSLAEGLRGGNARGSREDVLALMRNGAGGLACMLRGAEHHYLNYGPGAEVLFDLREDPSMYVNQAGNPKYASALSHVRARALARTLAASDPVTEKVHNY
ncbi:MAG: sulfatase-like hydrolase/transferase [Planctomycetota bacterium]|nr:sulfatase-like hydrolase/transferase [Planctomycetota bacterium]